MFKYAEIRSELLVCNHRHITTISLPHKQCITAILTDVACQLTEFHKHEKSFGHIFHWLLFYTSFYTSLKLHYFTLFNIGLKYILRALGEPRVSVIHSFVSCLILYSVCVTDSTAYGNNFIFPSKWDLIIHNRMNNKAFL